ncbi:MAG: hypothetical protein AAF433_03975 [Bacteroidota bacterium]
MNEQTKYSFLPWLRRGIANNISGAEGQRATIPVSLKIGGKNKAGDDLNLPLITRDVQVYGPGDVIGLDKKNIIRTEPKHWITNFEPNYLAFIDFYDEDLPWRYSPAQPVGHRLQPWMALIILTEEEFDDAPLKPEQPLAAIQLKASDPLAVLPAASELWAWAHVQLNESILGENHRSEAGGIIGPAVEQLLDDDPDMGFSRVICPRRPEADQAYHAFLIPTYESGRLAGLGQAIPTDLAATAPAWQAGQVPTELPYYHRFYFRTGGEGDFEYLVRLLKPRPVSAEVGRRPIDVQSPGANIPGINDADLEGFLFLEGALRVPDKSLSDEELERIRRYRNWDGDDAAYPHPFQQKLADFINLSDAYRNQSAAAANAASEVDGPPAAPTDPDPDPAEYNISNNPDPIITAPLYGRWHALTERLLQEADGTNVPNWRNWVHQLNLDPRHRTSAGFGTRIIQEGQEDYMKASWEQVGEILEANRRIKLAQLAREVGRTYYVGYLRPGLEQTFPTGQAHANQRGLSLTAPLHNRVLTDDNQTVRHELTTTLLPPALLSPQLRKLTRPRAPLAKRINYSAAPADIKTTNLIDRAAGGSVSAAPDREVPEGMPTHEEVGEAAGPEASNSWLAILREWLIKLPWLRFVPLILLVVLWLLALLFGWLIGLALGSLLGVSAALIGAFFWLTRLINNPPPAATDPLDPVATPPEAVDNFPSSSNFRITEIGEDFTPNEDGADSPEGVAYKVALKDYFTTVQENADSAPPRTYTPVDPSLLRTVVIQQINPEIRVPERTWAGIRLPDILIAQQALERFVPAMAYPRIDQPMYEPLVDQNPNWFLPNIDRIPQNSITLLETNQPFIEAYMVGLNHEMGRELLWREYPTDRRGSYFRKFWESVDLDPDPNQTEEERRENTYDIPKLHRWSKRNQLGDHDLREIKRREENPPTPGEPPREEAVLVIRGELLKKYPNAIIYAQRAKWQLKQENGQQVPDNTLPRLLADVEDFPPDTEKREYQRYPIYEAQVQPDIYFFGFDLTVEEARGEKGDDADDDPGWFFVIQEQPGEPRFGLDLGEASTPVEVWNDLSWDHVGVNDGAVLRINGSTTAIPLDPLELENPNPGPGEEPVGEDAIKFEQRQEDDEINWDADMNAADLAYILYQVPMLVAVHAADMVKAQPKD